MRPTVAVNVLLSGSCSRSSCSQIIYGGKSGFLSEGSRGHPPRLHQSNLSTWLQHLSTHKSAGSPWHSCFFVIFLPSTCLHLQVTCCKHRSLFFLFCYFSFAACLTRPDVPLWKHLQLDASLSGACHTHPSRLLQAGFLVISDFRSFSSEAALPAPPLSDHSRCITRLLSSRITPASRQEEALSLSLSLPVQKSKIAALINVSFKIEPVPFWPSERDRVCLKGPECNI